MFKYKPNDLSTHHTCIALFRSESYKLRIKLHQDPKVWLHTPVEVDIDYLPVGCVDIHLKIDYEKQVSGCNIDDLPQDIAEFPRCYFEEYSGDSGDWIWVN